MKIQNRSWVSDGFRKQAPIFPIKQRTAYNQRTRRSPRWKAPKGQWPWKSEDNCRLH